MNRAPHPLPDYENLPILDGAPPESSWGLWGENDVFGTLNLLTQERVAAGIASVKRHHAFPLDLPISAIDPPLFKRASITHTVVDLPFGHDDHVSTFNPQSSSQWDGFRHIKHPKYGYYNGLADESHGVEHWAVRGIVGRGILVDIDRWRRECGTPIEHGAPEEIPPSDITGALKYQQTEVEPGDILLVRTGWLTWYRELDPSARAELASRDAYGLTFAGLSPKRETAKLLWDLHISAFATDNPAVERWPRGWPRHPEDVRACLTDPDVDEDIFLHYRLIALLGIPLGELWDLDRLASDCATHGTYDFLLSAAPWGVAQGVASPANAIAIR